MSSQNNRYTVQQDPRNSNNSQQNVLENNKSEIIINRYKFDKESTIGYGSYGTVLHGKDLSKGEKIAVKLLDKKKASDPEVALSINNELKIHTTVNHPHIIKVTDCFEDLNFVYLIMEVATRGNLYQYITRQTVLKEDEAFIYFFQTLLGLDYLHDKGIAHRDIKPENLLLDEDCNIKICDFGWSCYESLDEFQSFIGTLPYMAPELLLRQRYNSKVDLWAMGILLYEMLHGTTPFECDNDENTVQRVLSSDQNPAEFKDYFYSGDVLDLIKKLLICDPDERFDIHQVFDHRWVRIMSKKFSIDIPKIRNSNHSKRRIMTEKPKSSPRVIIENEGPKSSPRVTRETEGPKQSPRIVKKHESPKPSSRISTKYEGLKPIPRLALKSEDIKPSPGISKKYQDSEPNLRISTQSIGSKSSPRMPKNPGSIKEIIYQNNNGGSIQYENINQNNGNSSRFYSKSFVQQTTPTIEHTRTKTEYYLPKAIKRVTTKPKLETVNTVDVPENIIRNYQINTHPLDNRSKTMTEPIFKTLSTSYTIDNKGNKITNSIKNDTLQRSYDNITTLKMKKNTNMVQSHTTSRIQKRKSHDPSKYTNLFRQKQTSIEDSNKNVARLKTDEKTLARGTSGLRNSFLKERINTEETPYQDSQLINTKNQQNTHKRTDSKKQITDQITKNVHYDNQTKNTNQFFKDNTKTLTQPEASKEIKYDVLKKSDDHKVPHNSHDFGWENQYETFGVKNSPKKESVFDSAIVKNDESPITLVPKLDIKDKTIFTLPNLDITSENYEENFYNKDSDNLFINSNNDFDNNTPKDNHILISNNMSKEQPKQTVINNSKSSPLKIRQSIIDKLSHDKVIIEESLTYNSEISIKSYQKSFESKSIGKKVSPNDANSQKKSESPIFFSINNNMPEEESPEGKDLLASKKNKSISLDKEKLSTTSKKSNQNNTNSKAIELPKIADTIYINSESKSSRQNDLSKSLSIEKNNQSLVVAQDSMKELSAKRNSKSNTDEKHNQQDNNVILNQNTNVENQENTAEVQNTNSEKIVNKININFYNNVVNNFKGNNFEAENNRVIENIDVPPKSEKRKNLNQSLPTTKNHLSMNNVPVLNSISNSDFHSNNESKNEHIKNNNTYLFESNMINLNYNINMPNVKIEQNMNDGSFNHNDFGYMDGSPQDSMYPQTPQEGVRNINESQYNKINDKTFDMHRIYDYKNLIGNNLVDGNTSTFYSKGFIQSDKQKIATQTKKEEVMNNGNIQKANKNQKKGFLKNLFGFLGCTTREIKDENGQLKGLDRPSRSNRKKK